MIGLQIPFLDIVVSFVMRGFLQVLNDDLLREILSYWIPATCLTALDTAFCNHTDRPLLVLLLERAIVADYFECFRPAKGFISWTALRKIRLQSLWLTSGAIAE